jgi:glycosyltransferase involved in cell wall biosynthesis
VTWSSSVQRIQPRIAVICSGADTIKRGYETYARDLFGLLTEYEFDAILVKGSGGRKPREIVVLNFGRDSLANRLICRVVGQQWRYYIEFATFAVGLVPILLRHRFDVLYVLEAPIYKFLNRWRRRLRLRYKLIAFTGGQLGNVPASELDYLHHVTPAFKEAGLVGGFRADNQFLIPHFISVDAFAASCDRAELNSLRTRFGIAPGTKVILSVGAIDTNVKRMDYVVKEVSKLVEPAFLLLVGQREESTAKVEYLARTLLEGRHAIVSVPREQVAHYYKLANVFVLASLREGFGLVLLEALASGLPVIAHDYDIAHFVLDGYATYADLAQADSLTRALEQVLGGEQTEATKEARIRYVRSRFDVRSLAPEYLEMMRAVTGGGATLRQLALSESAKTKARIVILTGHHVCHNPRAFKEAETLVAEGYGVEWLGAWYDPVLADRDRLLLRDCRWGFTPVADWTTRSIRGWWTRQYQRFRRRLGIELHKLLKLENRWQLGYCTTELYRAAVARNADLFIAHSESAMWVAVQLQKSGCRVGVDMEDWFSEDLQPAERKQRPLRLIRHLEKALLTTASYRSCTSEAMNDALVRAYQCSPLSVIYNAFCTTDRSRVEGVFKDRNDPGIASVHWFSQNIGPGRGLEDLFAALQLLTSDFEVHLRGGVTSSTRRWVEQLTPAQWTSRVFLHPVVHNDELLSRVAEHDIGLALDPSTPPSRDVTITNKILQYLLAGVAVVASDTAGHREVEAYAQRAVFIYQSGNAEDLAEKLQGVLSDPAEIQDAKKAALNAARRDFCWENEASKLRRDIEKALLYKWEHRERNCCEYY